MALRTVNTPGGPIMYDDGLPDPQEALQAEREQAEVARRQLVDAQALEPADRPDRPLNIEPPVADSAQPAPVAAAPAADPDFDKFLAAEQAKVDAPAPPPPAAAPVEAPAADTGPRVTQDSNFKEVIVDPASGTQDVGGLNPDAQAAQRKAERAAALDAQEATLQTQFADTMNVDPTLLSPEERNRFAAKQNEINRQLSDIGIQRAAEAGDAVAARQLAIQKQAERDLALKQRDAEIQKRAIESEYKYKTQHLDALDEEAANRKIDRSWGGGSTGRAVMLGVMAAIAGLGSALKGQGDKNPALDIIMKSIDERVADQFAAKKAGMEDRARQRNRLDVYRDSKVLGIDQQQAAARIALMKQAANEMEQVAATLPAAKKAAVSEAAKAVRERAIKGRDELNKTMYEQAKFDIEQAEKERAAKADEANARRAIGATYARIGEDRRQFNVLNDRYNSEEAVATRKADRDKTLAEIEKLKAEATGDAAKLKALEAQKKALEIQAAQDDQTVKAMEPTVVLDEKTGLPVTNPDGTFVMTVGNFKQPDGKTDVTLKGNETERRQVRDQLAAVGQTMSVIDDLVTHIEKNGWSPDVAKSDAWMKAQTMMTMLQLEGKDVYQLGALAGPDMAILSKLFGGDPTRLIGDPTVSLRTARNGLEEAAYRRFSQKSDYTGTLEDFHTTERNRHGAEEETKNTPSEGLLKGSKERGAGIGQGTGEGALQPTAFYEEENAGLAPPDWSDPRGYPSPAAEDKIITLAEQAASKDKAVAEPAKVALKNLIADEGHTPTRRFIVRELRRTRADLGIKGFTPQAYDAYDLAEKAAGGTAPGIVPKGTPRGNYRGALGALPVQPTEE